MTGRVSSCIMKRMKSRGKNLKRIFLAALALSILGALYAHFGILPGRAKTLAVEKIREATGKKVVFEKALWLPLQGFVLYGLDVSEKNDMPLFSAKRLALDVKIIPFFREKKIVFRNVLLESPVYDLVLDRPKIVIAKPQPKTEISGQIGVPTLEDSKKIRLEDVTGGPDAFLPENVYIEQIQISNGFVAVRKNDNSTPSETIHGINVRMAFQKPPYLHFDGSFRLGDKTYAKISLKGMWDLKRASYEFKLTTDWDSVPFWLKNYQRSNFLTLEEGRVRLTTRLRSVGEEKALFDADAELRDAEIRIKEGRYRGKLQVKAKGLFNFLSKKVERYKGSLELVDVAISDLSPAIPLIEGVTGKIDFQPDLLTIESLRGKYQDVPFESRGSVTSFKDLIVKGQIYMHVTLEKIASLIPEAQKRFIKDFDIRGDCEALTMITGSLKRREDLITEHKMVLKNATMAHRTKKFELVNLFCEIDAAKSGFKVSDARFDLGDKKYRVELFIPPDASKQGSLTLDTKDLSLKTDYRMEEGRIAIQNAAASMPGISARFDGLLHLLETPALDIEGRTDLNLVQISKSFPEKTAWMKDAGLGGVLHGAFSFKGPWNDFQRAEVTLKAEGSPVFAKQTVRLENLAVEAFMKNGLLTITHATANAYKGMIGLKGLFDFTKPGVGFDVNLYINDMDLNALAHAMRFQNKKLAGKLLLQLSMRGLFNAKESYEGSGTVSVKNGWLMETSQFKAMGNLPLVKVEGLDLVVFHDLSAAFRVHEQKIWSQNIALLSDTVHLDLSGWIGFDQQMELLMNIEYTNAVFLGAEDAGGLAPLMVNQAQDLISQYRVTGTLKDPRYDKVSAPLTQALGRKLGDLIQGLTS